MDEFKNTLATRLSDQQRELTGYLVDGRWHGAGELYSRMVNWRTRMSELRRIYPDRFEYRWRTHTVNGKRITSKDWRDVKMGAALRIRIFAAVQALQEAEPRRIAGHEREVISLGEGAVYGFVTRGQLAYLDAKHLTQQIWNRYVDPFREGEQ